MLHPVAFLVSWWKTCLLTLHSLCFLLAIWQHLYWKALNCWAPCVHSPPTTHKHTHTHILHTQLQCRWSNRLLFTCLLAEFGVWAWLWACTCTVASSDTSKAVARMYGQSGRPAVARRSGCIGIKNDTEVNRGWGPHARCLAAVSITGIRQTQSATTTMCNNNAFIYLRPNTQEPNSVKVCKQSSTPSSGAVSLNQRLCKEKQDFWL